MDQFSSLYIGLSFVSLQAFRKSIWENDRLERAETGFAKMSASSFKNLPESLLLQQL